MPPSCGRTKAASCTKQLLLVLQWSAGKFETGGADVLFPTARSQRARQGAGGETFTDRDDTSTQIIGLLAGIPNSIDNGRVTLKQHLIENLDRSDQGMNLGHIRRKERRPNSGRLAALRQLYFESWQKPRSWLPHKRYTSPHVRRPATERPSACQKRVPAPCARNLPDGSHVWDAPSARCSWSPQQCLQRCGAW